MLIELHNVTDEESAKAAVIELSKQHPGKYLFVRPCFGVFACILDRLEVESPGDSHYDWYVLNGKVKSFTEKQRIADQTKNWRD